MPERLPADLYSGERRVGQWRSAARDGGVALGLALLQLDAQPGQRLARTAGGDSTIEVLASGGGR
jgi:hypothetical protein